MANSPLIRDQPNLKVRLSPDDYQAIKTLAEQNERSVAAEIRVAVRHYLKGVK